MHCNLFVWTANTAICVHVTVSARAGYVCLSNFSSLQHALQCLKPLKASAVALPAPLLLFGEFTSFFFSLLFPTLTE